MNTTTAQSLQPSTFGSQYHPAVVAGLGYLMPTQELPCSYAYEPPPGIPWENCEYELRQMVIADARGAVERTSIDREGFELWDAPTAVSDFLDEEAVKTIYYREASELALAVTGAQHAYVFDHLVRRREHDRAALSFGRKGTDGRAAANGRIHNDYTEASGHKRLALVLTDPDVAVRVKRYAIVNVWRSIKGPVLDTPLAVCDARTVMAANLVTSEVRYPRRTGEIYHAVHSPQHHWSYYSKMDRHEALVFKQYDSQISGVARFVPHAAFDHPHMPPNAPLRESIELRCLVVYE
ncbi:CmcJ/NvfI family oxidoreductase [Acidovorax sp.]|uniref:CmcJ/NvfI family oxidoreductase n=1 Tax=Acidovorax sp. TaxID=1872122 RepID=UPI0026103FE3|nr:CmcJ/NvfI family oxidoreductase [Acidovorax sp.]